MKEFHVKVTCTLLKNCTVEDAEMEANSEGDHYYDLEALCADEAREKALDRFHDKNAIGNLDVVEVDAEIITPLEGVCDNCGHTAEDHQADNGGTRCWNGSGNGNTCACRQFVERAPADFRRRLELQRREDGWWYQCWHRSSEGDSLVADWQFGAKIRDHAIERAQARFGQDYEP
jgi:hypothetical protein